MIKYHYHRADRDVPRMGVDEGDRLCHVYSDDSLEELVAWGRRHGLKPGWIDRGHALPHFDVAVDGFTGELGEGVEREELVADIRAWRGRGDGEPDGSG